MNNVLALADLRKASDFLTFPGHNPSSQEAAIFVSDSHLFQKLFEYLRVCLAGDRKCKE
jgi:hypothetical protein